MTYQQAILALAFEEPHISIDSAVKYQEKDGKKKVKLTLRNTTNNFISTNNVELEGFSDFHTDQLRNIYVSLLNEHNVIVSEPYEVKIITMPFDKPVFVDFALLQDIDYITVRTIFGNTNIDKTVMLQKDESSDKVLVTSEQFSQEADLGTQTNYDLKLEPFSTKVNIYQLEVLNLPSQFTYDFLDPQTGAHLSQVRFAHNVNTRHLFLRVYVPERYDSTSFFIDQRIVFFALAVPKTRLSLLDREKKHTPADLDQQNMNYVKLELIPRGRGRLNVSTKNYYYEVKARESIQMNLDIANEGTRSLHNVEIDIDIPSNWYGTVSPDLIKTLSPGKLERLVLLITFPEDVGIGDYIVTIKTKALSKGRRVEAEDKVIRIHVAANTNIWGTTILLITAVTLVIGIIIYGVRLSRK